MKEAIGRSALADRPIDDWCKGEGEGCMPGLTIPCWIVKPGLQTDVLRRACSRIPLDELRSMSNEFWVFEE